MDKTLALFEEFVLKAIVRTEETLNLDFRDEQKLDFFINNRERLMQIIEQISQQINWSEVAPEKCEELNRQIDYIKKLDEKLLCKLQEYKGELQQDIEKTFKQKENIKGYNLTDVK
jgi:hypothetical protein